ncbi:hypothetical protein KRMM14A1259_62990 [Krasilnikovia sp. MM14-A1259]
MGAPNKLIDVVVLAGFDIAFISFGPAFVCMAILQAQNYQMFNAHSTKVAAALGRDLFRLHAPPPFVEAPWPPPQWQPTHIEGFGGDRSSSASGG